MDLSFFNVKDGFTEALVRGLRSGFLGPEDYRRLSSADNMEDIRSALEDSDYGQFMQDEPSPIQVATMTAKCKQKLADEFRYMRSQSTGDLGKFLDFIAAEKMIDNIVGLIQGTINNKPPQELLAKTDPLGDFPEMKTIPSMDITSGYDDIYKTILIDTPVGPYFEEFLKTVGSSEESKSMGEIGSILTETDLEIMKQSLKKAWLEDFYSFTMSLGGGTAEVCGHILKMEADFRVLLVTLNALNTPLGSAQKLQDRNALYPSFGYLYPEGTDKIRKAWNETTVRAALEPYLQYLQLFDQVKSFYDKEKKDSTTTRGAKSLEDLLYLENVKLYELAFEQQYHFGVFYAWVKLREQEIRNLEWIANMVLMNKKDHVDDIVPIFQPRV